MPVNRVVVSAMLFFCLSSSTWSPNLRAMLYSVSPVTTVYLRSVCSSLTTKICPGLMSARSMLFQRLSDSTLTLNRRAMPHSVSPCCTICVAPPFTLRRIGFDGLRAICCVQIVSCCRGLIKPESSLFQAIRSFKATPWSPAIWLSESPGRTVYVICDRSFWGVDRVGAPTGI